MNPWIIIALIGAGIVFLIDYIVRRKKWSDNTKAEKGSLIFIWHPWVFMYLDPFWACYGALQEVVLTLLANVLIGLAAYLLFDRKGEYRKGKRKNK